MRRPAIALAILAGIFGTAGTDVRAEPLAGSRCIAVGSGVQHVAATVARPEDCCSGRMQCSQFLSTTRVVRPARDQRT